MENASFKKEYYIDNYMIGYHWLCETESWTGFSCKDLEVVKIKAGFFRIDLNPKLNVSEAFIGCS